MQIEKVKKSEGFKQNPSGYSENQKNKKVKRRYYNPLNKNKFGSVGSRNGRLHYDFYYIGKRVRVATEYDNTPENKLIARAKLDQIGASIVLNDFSFSETFPHHQRAQEFAILEGIIIPKKPNEITFGEYYNELFPAIKDNYEIIRQRDFKRAIEGFALPYFGNIPFSRFSRPLIEKFCAKFKKMKCHTGEPLSVKTTHNYFEWIRKVIESAAEEYDWDEKKFKKMCHKPPLDAVPDYNFKVFKHAEWARLLPHIPLFYRGYYDLFVARGLRPEESIALKKKDLESGYIHVRRTRKNGKETHKMKTKHSKRRIAITPKIQAIFDNQEMLADKIGYNGPYVFFNEWKRPISPKVMMKNIWHPALKAANLEPRRQYDCRHTFASWALAAGEKIVWVSRTMGHTNPWNTFKRYVDWVKNPNGPDGSFIDGSIPNVGFDLDI